MAWTSFGTGGASSFIRNAMCKIVRSFHEIDLSTHPPSPRKAGESLRWFCSAMTSLIVTMSILCMILFDIVTSILLTMALPDFMTISSAKDTNHHPYIIKTRSPTIFMDSSYA